jgi:putative redox protein
MGQNAPMVSVEWKGSMVFEATPPSGIRFSMDAYPEVGGKGLGPTPVEALLGALAGCSGMDVISILHKKQQVVTGYRIEVEGARTSEGEWPRPFQSIVIRHIVSGENLDPAAVARAVQLSDEKYCSVLATLRSTPEIRSEWQIE